MRWRGVRRTPTPPPPVCSHPLCRSAAVYTFTLTGPDGATTPLYACRPCADGLTWVGSTHYPQVIIEIRPL